MSYLIGRLTKKELTKQEAMIFFVEMALLVCVIGGLLIYTAETMMGNPVDWPKLIAVSSAPIVSSAVTCFLIWTMK